MLAALEVKEQLYQLQRQLLERGPAVIQIGLNMPGGFGLYPWERLFARATSRVMQSLQAEGLEVLDQIVLQTVIGPFRLVSVQKGGVRIKELMVAIETEAPCGRLWDLDVITPAGPVDRAALGLPPRPCLLCPEDAHICRKLGSHAQAEIIAAAQKIAAQAGDLS